MSLMRPVDMVLSRLDGFKLAATGRDRWRACCPAHGGSNRSALSIGVGDNDAVLLKCWHGCDVEQVAAALGLELNDLFPPRETHAGPVKRRRLLTAGQALDLLEREAMLVVLCASDVAGGKPLDEPTRERLLLAAARVVELRAEAAA